MAISTVTEWTALTPGGSPYTINTAGADCLIIANIALNSGFTAGLATPGTLTLDSTNVKTTNAYEYHNSGGAADALAVYVVTGAALTGGNQTLTITQQAGPFGGGPRSAYKLLAGVKQSGPVRTGSVQADDTTGTSINLSLTSLVAGDQVEWVCGDFGDTSHGAQGNYVEKLDSTANNSESIVCGTFVVSGTTATGGPTTGAALFGAAFPFIVAGATTTNQAVNATSSGSTSTVKSVSQTRAVTSSGSVAVTAQYTKIVAVLAACASVVVASIAIVFARTVSAASTGVVALTKSIAKAIAATAAGAVNVTAHVPSVTAQAIDVTASAAVSILAYVQKIGDVWAQVREGSIWIRVNRIMFRQ